MCKDKLKSMQFSDLLPKHPRTREDALCSNFVRTVESRGGLPGDVNADGCDSCEPCAPDRPAEALDVVRSQESVQPLVCEREEPENTFEDAGQREEDLRREEAAKYVYISYNNT